MSIKRTNDDVFNAGSADDVKFSAIYSWGWVNCASYSSILTWCQYHSLQNTNITDFYLLIMHVQFRTFNWGWLVGELQQGLYHLDHC